MARVGGRNSWIAVPTGVACAAIVAGLVWLSMPMVPVTVAWAGDMLRNATTPKPEPSPGDTPARRAAAGAALDCRAIYTDALWNEMTWTGRTILDQSYDPPATAVTSLIEVLVPDVRLTCGWTAGDRGNVVSTLAVVASDASDIAEAALRGQGFSCAPGDAGLRCTRAEGDALETHLFRDGLWLCSVESTWHPDDYAARLERGVFG
ncbi:hypothetical protein [Microbacterium sulfonylureivorans]|uniref:hypothetical protein n=1 Tax=Microbacterium sulfonylureivorans TaxID=2486854 RepID=UPI000FD8071B|nr:hypothetical protein [Microbacterium sulfonylureivorans]